ncbi:MAG: GTP-binding protein, partial [Planctomycetes bacterium]|nr:GTP-binding protein [Planctomycetota bacterium]
VLTVVDPAVIPDLDETSRTILREQMNSAGRILVSRTGGLDEQDRRAASEAVAAFLDGSAEGRIDTRSWDELTGGDFAELSLAGYRRSTDGGRYWDHATLYDAVVVKAAAEFDAAEVADAVAATFRDVGDVIRLKGYAPRRGGGFHEVNCTRRDRGIHETGGNHRAFVVAIGRAMNRARLERLFSQAGQPADQT